MTIQVETDYNKIPAFFRKMMTTTEERNDDVKHNIHNAVMKYYHKNKAVLNARRVKQRRDKRQTTPET